MHLAGKWGSGRRPKLWTSNQILDRPIKNLLASHLFLGSFARVGFFEVREGPVAIFTTPTPGEYAATRYPPIEHTQAPFLAYSLSMPESGWR